MPNTVQRHAMLHGVECGSEEHQVDIQGRHTITPAAVIQPSGGEVGDAWHSSTAATRRELRNLIAWSRAVWPPVHAKSWLIPLLWKNSVLPVFHRSLNCYLFQLPRTPASLDGQSYYSYNNRKHQPIPRSLPWDGRMNLACTNQIYRIDEQYNLDYVLS